MVKIQIPFFFKPFFSGFIQKAMIWGVPFFFPFFFMECPGHHVRTQITGFNTVLYRFLTGFFHAVDSEFYTGLIQLFSCFFTVFFTFFFTGFQPASSSKKNEKNNN